MPPAPPVLRLLIQAPLARSLAHPLCSLDETWPNKPSSAPQNKDHCFERTSPSHWCVALPEASIDGVPLAGSIRSPAARVAHPMVCPISSQRPEKTLAQASRLSLNTVFKFVSRQKSCLLFSSSSASPQSDSSRPGRSGDAWWPRSSLNKTHPSGALERV